MAGLHQCPCCGYKFEDAESLEQHDCPEQYS
jgi:rubredoxin